MAILMSPWTMNAPKQADHLQTILQNQSSSSSQTTYLHLNSSNKLMIYQYMMQRAMRDRSARSIAAQNTKDRDSFSSSYGISTVVYVAGPRYQTKTSADDKEMQACQAYVQRLCEVITPSAYFSLPTPTTITILGCGEPYLIPRYGTKTHCPFRMYTDPSLRLYKLFGMTRHNLRMGKRPDYHPDNLPKLVAKSVAAMVKAGRRDGLKGGPIMLVGGEVLFEEGQPIWCHRMKDLRGHADFRTLARVLEMPEDKDGYPDTPEGIRLESSSSKSQRGVESATSVSAERPTGLKLVYDTSRSDVRRARLARDSREYS